MERQGLLAGLLVVTLIVNVVLGIELYYALHRPSIPSSQVPLNVSNVQIVTSSSGTSQTVTVTTTVTTNQQTTTSYSQTTQTSTASQTSTATTTTANQTIYKFSFMAKLNLSLKYKGEYIVGINPKVNFTQLYVILYFEDGKVVSLSLNHTYSYINISDKKVKVTLFITGESYENLTYEQILNDIGLYFQLISPSTEGDQGNDNLIVPVLLFVIKFLTSEVSFINIIKLI
ncbi:MAG: hypothetical protein OWQ54_09015 [Sulfolobaceae archaeon]|nr:hypothetical protein [Sulfolobaceae archaeon]